MDNQAGIIGLFLEKAKASTQRPLLKMLPKPVFAEYYLGIWFLTILERMPGNKRLR